MKKEIQNILIEKHLAGKILLAVALFVLSLYLFVEIADEVIEREALIYDQQILGVIHGLSPHLDYLFLIGTNFGGIIAVILIGGAAVGWLLRRQRWRQAVFLVTSLGGAAVINVAMKLLFARERPDLWQQLITETNFSFPSGHAMASSALVFSLVVLLWNTKWRKLILWGGIPYVVFIGFSRLYLGVHYPTDILAGWCVSLAWIATAWAIVFVIRHK